MAARRSGVAYVVLGGVLFGAFLAAVAFFLPRDSSVEASHLADTAVLTGLRSYVRVHHSSALDPTPQQDLVVIGWYRLKKLPKEGEKLFLFSKFDPRQEAQSGYAVALTREGGTIRPAVYWRNPAGKGGWFSFAEVDLKPSKWFAVVLSFYSGRYLGLHLRVEQKEPSQLPDMQLAGGFELDEDIYPQSRSNLIIGSWGGGAEFHGRVGAFCMLQMENLNEGLDNILTAVSLNPDESVARLESESMSFCTLDTKTDISETRHAIELISQRETRGRTKKRKSNASNKE